MGGRPLHPDFLFAWPSAEMGFMAPSTGVRTVNRRRLEAILDSEGREAMEAAAAALEVEWEAESEPWEAAAHIALDDVIEPARTRDCLVQALKYAWGSHGERISRP